jgi:hypothetical protein
LASSRLSDLASDSSFSREGLGIVFVSFDIIRIGFFLWDRARRGW